MVQQRFQQYHSIEPLLEPLRYIPQYQICFQINFYRSKANNNYGTYTLGNYSNKFKKNLPHLVLQPIQTMPFKYSILLFCITCLYSSCIAYLRSAILLHVYTVIAKLLFIYTTVKQLSNDVSTCHALRHSVIPFFEMCISKIITVFCGSCLMIAS